MTLDLLQKMFTVNGSKVKVTAWRNVSATKIVTCHERIGWLSLKCVNITPQLSSVAVKMSRKISLKLLRNILACIHCTLYTEQWVGLSYIGYVTRFKSNHSLSTVFNSNISLSFSILFNRYPGNLLTLNFFKTNFFLIGLPQQLAKINTSSLCSQLICSLSLSISLL